MKEKIKATIVIVTYNAEKYLDDCLGGLAAMRRGDIDVGVIVVDNASQDSTAASIKARFPFATLIENDANLGFAGGNNVGLRRALEQGADFVYLLNQDTEVMPDFLIEAARAAQTDETVGAAQSLLLLSPEKDRINSAGNAVHFLGFGYCLDYRRPVKAWLPPASPVITYASGAAVMYRAAALRKIGLFDEELFMYHEDLDLGWRLRLAGYRSVLAPRSVVYHKYEFGRSIAKYYYMERNRYIVLLKNLRVRSLIVLAPWLALAELGLLVAAWRGGWWREKLKVYGYFFDFEKWRRIVAKRRRIEAFRTVSDREIVRRFVSAIDYQEVGGVFTKKIANPLMTAAWFVLRLFIL